MMESNKTIIYIKDIAKRNTDTITPGFYTNSLQRQMYYQFSLSPLYKLYKFEILKMRVVTKFRTGPTGKSYALLSSMSVTNLSTVRDHNLMKSISRYKNLSHPISIKTLVWIKEMNDMLKDVVANSEPISLIAIRNKNKSIHRLFYFPFSINKKVIDIGNSDNFNFTMTIPLSAIRAVDIVYFMNNNGFKLCTDHYKSLYRQSKKTFPIRSYAKRDILKFNNIKKETKQHD